MRKLIVALILFSAQLLLAAPTMNNCRRFFNYPDGTNELISYVESISNLPSLNLQKFYQAVAHGELENPISIPAARVNAELQIHRTGIEQILEQSSFDMQKLSAWAITRGTHVETTRQDRTSVEVKTELAARPFRLVTIEEMNLQIMDGPVTQYMWAQVFGKIPSGLEQQDDIEAVKVDGIQMAMAPNHPVTSITFWSAVAFANEMSRKHNLPEAYDLSAFGNPGGEFFALGTFSMPDKERIKKFVEDNTPELIAAREGLRLPTVQEYQRLVYELARFNGKKVAELTTAERRKFFEDFKVHAVGNDLEPAVIGANVINDLLGNIWFLSSTFVAIDLQNNWDVSTLGHGCGDWYLAYKPETGLTDLSARGTARGIILVRTVRP